MPEYFVICCHLVLAVVLFGLVNLVGKLSTHAGYMNLSVLARTDEAPAFNFVYRSIAPIVFLVIAAVGFSVTGLKELNGNLYFVVIFYIIVRVLFNIVTGRARLLNWPLQLAQWVVTILGSLYVYNHLILSNSLLLPDKHDLSIAIWLAIGAFLYKTANAMRISSTGTTRRKRSYVFHRFHFYRKKYGKVIDQIATDNSLKSLVYSVLIYEAFQRPKLYRVIENLLFGFGMARTLGIMQVKTSVPISDERSIVLGATMLKDSFHKYSTTHKYGNDDDVMQGYVTRSLRHKVAFEYNPDLTYANEVCELCETIDGLLNEHPDNQQP